MNRWLTTGKAIHHLPEISRNESEMFSDVILYTGLHGYYDYLEAILLLNITDVNLDEQGREQMLAELSIVKWKVTEACC